jgi:uncharacterized membrane protein YciS (DUF1049 family)
MKLRICIIILIFSMSLNAGAQEKYNLTYNYKDLSFTDFAAKVESVLPVRFFYMDDWVRDLKIGDYPDCK